MTKSDLIRRADVVRLLVERYKFTTSEATEILSQLPSAEAKWIPCSERLPEEHEWIGTKQFGTTKSDLINITFEVDGQRFVKVMSLQNGKLGLSDSQTMDAFYKGWKMIAWMPQPKPYREDGEE